jgi:hypothetical protein
MAWWAFVAMGSVSAMIAIIKSEHGSSENDSGSSSTSTSDSDSYTNYEASSSSDYNSDDSMSETENRDFEGDNDDSDAEDSSSSVTASFRVRLLDLAGDPVQGAEVTVRFSWTSHETRTDEDGYAEFEILFPTKRFYGNLEARRIGTEYDELAEDFALEDGETYTFKVSRENYE